MRVRFTATGGLAAYRGWHDGQRIIFGPGEEKELPQAKAEVLLRDFPANFICVESAPVSCEIEAAPVDRMFRRGRTKKR